ncbi:MAG TPA: FmdB family zinc ribbon protein [bacterium]
MPAYDYRCEQCGNEFEAFQRITEEPLSACPKCGGRVKRLISTGVGLIFKGTGFYVTDYKKKETEKSGKKPADKTVKTEAKKDQGGKGEGKSQAESTGKTKPA